MKTSVFSVIVLVLTSRLAKFETTSDYDEEGNYNYTKSPNADYNFKPEIPVQEEEINEGVTMNEEEEYDALTVPPEEEQESAPHKYQIPDQQRHEEASVDITSIGEGTLVVRGEYSFNVGGQIYKVSYVADSNGYRARVQQEKESSGLPTTVPPFSGIPTTVPGVSTAVPLPKISKNAIESIGGGRSGK